MFQFIFNSPKLHPREKNTSFFCPQMSDEDPDVLFHKLDFRTNTRENSWFRYLKYILFTLVYRIHLKWLRFTTVGNII